jgi:hypothetical protein
VEKLITMSLGVEQSETQQSPGFWVFYSLLHSWVY